MHAPELRRDHAKHSQLPGDPARPEVGSGAGSIERIGMDQLPDPRDEVACDPAARGCARR